MLNVWKTMIQDFQLIVCAIIDYSRLNSVVIKFNCDCIKFRDFLLLQLATLAIIFIILLGNKLIDRGMNKNMYVKIFNNNKNNTHTYTHSYNNNKFNIQKIDFSTHI